MRHRLAFICLIVFGLVGLSRYDWRNLPRFVRGALRGEDASSAQARAAGTGFWFDRDYPAFLEAVRAATPPRSTVAVALPKRPPAYLYQAVYTLAPRRVVTVQDALTAEYAAYFKVEAPVPARAAIRVPGGFLLRR